MLDAIAWAEGTAGDADNGYGRVVRGTVISCVLLDSLRACHNEEEECDAISFLGLILCDINLC